jgi:FHS family L-fucose permease-like MFS transporter
LVAADPVKKNHSLTCFVFSNFVQETGRSAATASNLLAVAQGIYAGNRFLAGFLMMIPAVKPRYMLTAYLTMCCILSLVAGLTRGTTSVAFLIMVLAFESCCFATIFTMSLRGLGRHTKRGGSWLVAAISGGTVFPCITGAVVTAHNAHVAMFIPMMGYILGMVFPVYVNVYQRDRMDVHRTTEVGVVAPNEKELEVERNQSVGGGADEPKAIEIREEDIK